MSTAAEMDSSLTPPPSDPMIPVMFPPKRKPRVWTVFAAWFAAIVMGGIAAVAAYIAVGIVMGFVMGAQGIDAATIQTRVQEFVSRPLPALFLTLLPFQLGMGAVILLAAWRSPEPLMRRLALASPASPMFGTLRLAAMGGFTVSAALGTVLVISLMLGNPASTPLDAAMRTGSWGTITLLSIVLSVVPALIEEVVFRGYIQRRLLQRWSAPVAILTSTLLFAIVHADSLQHIIAVMPLGLVTGVLACRTNSVRPGMIVHAIHNAAVVGFGALVATLTPRVGEETLGWTILGLMALLMLIGLPAVVALLRGTSSRPAEDDLAPMPVEDAMATQAA